MNESQVVDALSALSNEVRLKILKHLVAAGPEGDSAGLIGEAVSAAPSKVSFHISAMERAQLVTSERVSRKIIYRANFEQLGGMLNYLLTDCCKSDPVIMSCCGIEKISRCC
ncbi:MAG: ArsR/SmtB family transcription factor [Leucothrix sp.]